MKETSKPIKYFFLSAPTKNALAGLRRNKFMRLTLLVLELPNRKVGINDNYLFKIEQKILRLNKKYSQV